MQDIIQSSTATAIFKAGVVGVLTLLGVVLFMKRGENPSPKLATNASTTGGAKSMKNKKKSKGKSTAAPSSAPAPAKEEETAPPEPTASIKIKKKKKKKGGVDVSEPSSIPEVVSKTLDVPTPVPESAPVPEPISKSKKKRIKKSKAVSKPLETSSEPKFPTVTDNDIEDDDDSDDDMMVQASRLMSMKVRSNGKNSKMASSSKPQTTPVAASSNSKQSRAATAEIETQPKPEVLLDIGTDPALLIGPGGSTIQHITATSGARLDILKNTPEHGQNRVRITASDFASGSSEGDQASIAKAAEMVQALLDEQAAILANSKTITLSANDIDGQAGVKAIIGRGGETIQSILQKCNGEVNGNVAPSQLVKINANVEAGTVEVSGPKSLVDKAVKLCKQAVFGETQSTLKLQSRSEMNIVFGKDFRNIQQMQNSTGAKLDMNKDTLTLKISGKSEEVEAARAAVSSLLQRCKGITMDVKSSDVGAVYGKGGTTIRNIQDKTGAFIEVQNDGNFPPSGGEAIVKCMIMGEPDACEQARVLISKALAREVELKPDQVAETLSLGGAATAAVIGRGGSKIKELETAHSVSLNVIEDVCRIIGKESNVKAAKEAIQAIIEPILETEEAQKKATIAAEAGDSAWQAYEVPPEEDGW